MALIEKKKALQAEALANLGSAYVPLDGLRTTDIETDEPDVFERKRKFEELVKRMEDHRKEHMRLRGNDLRFNIYLRKMNKLARTDLGLDVEAYKDYINNLK